MAGTCFGFEIHSPLPFAYLRGGNGSTLDIEVDDISSEPGGEPIAQWTASSAVPWHGRLYESPAGFRLWMGDVGWFSIEADRTRITIPPSDDPLRREERLWGIPAMLCFMARGDLPLHASAIELNGGAVVLAAPRNSGKTTIAAAFADAGARVLSEDVTCVTTGTTPHVVPGPAMLRVRRDVAAWLAIRHAVTMEREPDLPRSEDDRIHYALARRGDCEPVPLRGIVVLQGHADTVEVASVDAPIVIRDMWSLSSRLPTSAGRAACFAGLVDVVRAVPAWSLRRPMDRSDLQPVLDTIMNLVGAGAAR